MDLDMKRMEKLGLKGFLEKKYRNDRLFQEALASRLREMTFLYIRGDLRELIPDGPEVRELRENLKESRTLDQFIRKQSRPREWATDVELTILAELIGANLAVTMIGGSEEPTILSKSPSEHKPTIFLHNEYNTHWSAVIGGVKQDTYADGNCGYNAFALSMASLTPAPRDEAAFFAARWIKQEEDRRLTASLREAQRAASEFERAMQRIQKKSPATYAKIQEQMHGDYLMALSLAMRELPGPDGRTSVPTGFLSRASMDKKYLSAVEQVLRELPMDDVEEMSSSSFRF